jgi:hypothetical protein
MMFNNLDELDDLLRSGYALRTLYDVVSEESLSVVNVSKLEDVVTQLEIHEAEVRRLRQSLSLRLRQHMLESYLENLKKRSHLPLVA